MTAPAPAPAPAKRSKRIYVYWGAGLALLAILGICCLYWRPIGLAVMRYGTSSKFRKNYDGSSNLRAAVHPYDWAVEFGGTASLKTLRTLEDDSRLTPAGRAEAKNVRTVIEKGQHLSYLDSLIRPGNGLPPPSGLRGCLLRYIYARDREYLKRRGATP